MNKNQILLFFLILLFSCRDKPQYLISDNSPDIFIEHVEYDNKKRTEIKCDTNNLLISQKVIDDSILIFEFVKFDTISKILPNNDFEEITYIKGLYSKLVYKDNKIIFKGMSSELDSIKFCICRKNCK